MFNFTQNTKGEQPTNNIFGKITEQMKPKAQDKFLKFKCKDCNNFLSVAPIKLVDTQYVCGRCAKEEGFRLEAMEALAETCMFPCQYSSLGCGMHLYFDNVTQHENLCSFKRINCLDKSCDWNGAMSGLKNHFETDHPKFLFEDQCDIMLTIDKQSEKNVLFLQNNFIFVIKLVNSGANILYTVNVFKSVFENALPKYDLILSWSNMQYIITGQTSIFSSKDSMNADIINISTLKNILGNVNEIKVSFKINMPQMSKKINYPEVTCALCNNKLCVDLFGSSVIYIMQCGHSYCGICKMQNINCRICGHSKAIVFGGPIRNFALEQFLKNNPSNSS